MLRLHYQDARERAQALISIAHRCLDFDARCVFFGSEADCEAAREAVKQLGADLPCLSFRFLDLAANATRGDQALVAEIEAVRASLLETSPAGGVLVAWIESPVSRNGVTTVQTLRAYYEALDTLARRTAATIISAFRLADLPERALFACVQGSSALISAKMIVPRCPAWLISRTRADLTPVACVPGHPLQPCTADALFGPIFQTEKLAALGHFAAGVAHELGNPLSIISSSLQYLHQRLADANDSASDFTLTALQNVERMHGLLQSMLDFASVKKPRLEQVDLEEAVSEVVRFTSAECIRRNSIVDVSFDPCLPKAWVDPCGFKQIILNLVKNALDALAQGGTTLRLHTCMGSNQRVIVKVENNGPAIPADVMTNMFRPFYTTKDGGTGLGLYLSRQIARDHGGDLEAENLQGAVRFTLTLPLDKRID